MLSYRKEEDVLIVWISGIPYASFEVKRRSRGDIFAYAFNGDFTIEEITEAKKIFEEYEEI